MFRVLFSHPQEPLRKRHMIYCMRIMSAGCATIAFVLQSWHSQLTQCEEYVEEHARKRCGLYIYK
jgi:hypothetical protein